MFPLGVFDVKQLIKGKSRLGPR